MSGSPKHASFLRRGLFAQTVVVSIVLALAGCGGFAVHETPASYHRVERGETLYSISWRYGQNHQQVAEWNNLPPPYVIHPGQRLRVSPPLAGQSKKTPPVQESRDAQAKTGTAPLGTRTAPPSANALPQPANVPPAASAGPADAAPTAWRWPTDGKVLRGFSAAEGRKGVDITGRPGQPVYAAAAGRIVYAGSGLLHYGNLIIIKHGENYLSAYGHNQLLRVNENDVVAMGQHIADMGRKGNGAPLLYFEIRYNGAPVDPARYLGAR